VTPNKRRLGVLLCAMALGAGAVGCSSSTELPQITFYSDYSTTVTGPTTYCSLDFTRCSTGTTAQLPVRIGSPLQISLPTAISDAPWRLLTSYRTPSGVDEVGQRYFRPGEKMAVTVTPPNPRDQLTGVEIQLPSGATDGNGNPIARATWSVHTDTAPIQP
jgi:hypothetical protein